ncbi:MAG: hypothetical protein ABL934_09820 [Lysobacteraceae bacterium]
MNLQEIYWLVGMVGVSGSVLTTAINIALYRRNRPDTVKLAVQQAIEPLLKRMDTMETTHRAQGAELSQQGRTLTKMESELQHMPSRDEYNRLYERLTDLVGKTGEITGAARAESALLDRINQFMMQAKP